MKRLSDQLAEAAVREAVARLDLEWEVERRQFCTITARNPSGEIPKHSTAIAFLVVGGVFALGMALVVLISAVGLFLLLPFAPLIALTVFIIASGVEQYSRASKYLKALARYESRRNSVRSTPLASNEHPDPTPEPDPLVAQQLADQVAEARYRAELTRLDREWEIERQKHYVTTKRGARFLPDRQQAFATAVAGVAVGAFLVLNGTPAFFPYFGVVFALFGIGGGIYLYALAKQYEHALAAYQSRRERLRPDQFRP